MQKFKFPMEYLRVTQGEYGTYSHQGSLAMDFGGKDTGSDKLYAPCDMVVKRARANANGELYLESIEQVQFADGTVDYARLLCIHDSVFNVAEGDTIAQGQYFYDEGGMGSGNANAYSTHVHIEGGKGKWVSTTQSANSYGKYIIENQSSLHDLFVLGQDVIVLDNGGYNWVVENVEEVANELADNRLQIGFASGGDVVTIGKLLDSLEVAYLAEDGFLITDMAVSNSNCNSIQALCEELGIPCVIYETPSLDQEEIETLKAEIVELEKQCNDKDVTILALQNETATLKNLIAVIHESTNL